MSFLKKLFGYKEQTPDYSHLSIHNFFLVDLYDLPDDSFIIKENVIAGDYSVTVFEKKLDYKECGIFDTIHARKFDHHDDIAINFKNLTPDKVPISQVKKVINDLFLIYGKDDQEKEAFNQEDKEDFRDESGFGYIIFGRKWYENQKLTIELGRDEDEIWLSIRGEKENFRP